MNRIFINWKICLIRDRRLRRSLKIRRIRLIFSDFLEYKNIDNVSMEILSMGMTGDYKVAIEEGATMVRVGTGIFGARNYKKSNESH